MARIPRILITPGDPAGIGPDICIMLAQQSWLAELIAVADPQLFSDRSKQIGIDLEIIELNTIHTPADRHQPGRLKIWPCALSHRAQAGVPDIHHAPYVLNSLKLATELCTSHQAQAIVTGPINKDLINRAGFNFSGHTEFLAKISGVSKTVMLFVTPSLRVALATTHLALNQVSTAITQETLSETIEVLHQGLEEQFKLDNPRILVCGLNPHAGEGGYLGREEIETISPVIQNFRAKNYTISGPFAADTIFTPAYLSKADAILAMYHDQALPVVKYASFGEAVNVSLGLPFIRTSVDHGTAFDKAGSGHAQAGSLKEALKLAIRLATATFSDGHR